MKSKSRGHSFKTGTIWQPAYGFLLALYSNFVSKIHGFEIFAFEKYRYLETWVKSH